MGDQIEKEKDELMLSICIPNYNAKGYLEKCLGSIQSAVEMTHEVIVIDDASTDGTPDLVRKNFPAVKVIVNETNQGFAKSVNRGLKEGKARYFLILNNDTLILPGTFEKLVGFMERNPAIGVVGPKILYPDGTMQKQCRRSFPTPWNIFCYFSGLSRLFPRNEWFAQYLMTYKSEAEIQEIDAVSGAFMLMRKEVVDAVGGFDEDYYLYGEDLDYCYRAKGKGWKVYYNPEAQIIHYGREGGTCAIPFRSFYEFHRSMWIYYKKHHFQNHGCAFNLLVLSGIMARGGLFILLKLLRLRKKR